MAYHKKATKTKDKKSVKDILRLRKKESKRKIREKRARLVVKNLPFEVSEENLKEHFSKYGDITDVQLLKKEDGKAKGCAFVQFKLVQKARKAKHYTNGQPFLGRNLDVDFAISKNEFEKKKIKTEVKLEKDFVIKEEPLDLHETSGKIEKVENNEVESQTKDEMNEDESEEDEEDCETINSDILSTCEKPTERIKSNDVSEGRTIFVKNIPFTATNEDLKECMNQFGRIFYALICVDKFTEHSKGTGFVKFHMKEDAEKALQAGTELTLLGSVLDCHKALNKTEIQSKVEMKNKKEVKDSRNLYLVKEGVIMAGNKSAEGVSASDMTKRLQLEQYKTQILRNLNMYVSRERLVIHNIPPSWDDKKLRILCAKHCGKAVKIKESRIMRDMKNVDAKGIGRSKEFGFVTLDNHENALALLRSLNNNPNVFSKTKRPIVSFSIEKKSAMKTKLKRLEQSRLKNPRSKFFDPKAVVEEKTENQKKINFEKEENLEEYSGLTASIGNQKFRSRMKLTAQAKKHQENLKKNKRAKKMTRKPLHERKKEFTKQERQKIGKNREKDDFSKLVTKYKKTISNAPDLKKKWYS